jgi:hypothetical protein
MLVLDEQFSGCDLETVLGRWYPGPVLFITDLLPGTVIKDDVIPVLLHQQRQATFLTINETDFWRKVAIDDRFCVVCFTLPDSRVRENPNLLRAVFRLPAFRTKTRRMRTVLGSRPPQSALTPTVIGRYEHCPSETFAREGCAV